MEVVCVLCAFVENAERQAASRAKAGRRKRGVDCGAKHAVYGGLRETSERYSQRRTQGGGEGQTQGRRKGALFDDVMGTGYGLVRRETKEGKLCRRSWSPAKQETGTFPSFWVTMARWRRLR